MRAGMPLVAERALRAEPVRVLLVDDHAAVREAIALAFRQEPDFEVAGQAASLAEARQMLQEVDVAVIDLGLPDGYGGDLVRDLREVNPQAQAIVLGASLDRSEIARAVDRGAAGVLEKTAGLDEVVHAVRRLHAGETLLPLTEVIELLRVAAATESASTRTGTRLRDSRRVSARCCGCSPRASTARASPTGCTSPSAPSATTSRTSSPSSACTPSSRRWCSRCATS